MRACPSPLPVAVRPCPPACGARSLSLRPPPPPTRRLCTAITRPCALCAACAPPPRTGPRMDLAPVTRALPLSTLHPPNAGHSSFESPPTLHGPFHSRVSTRLTRDIPVSSLHPPFTGPSVSSLHPPNSPKYLNSLKNRALSPSETLQNASISLKSHVLRPSEMLQNASNSLKNRVLRPSETLQNALNLAENQLNLSCLGRLMFMTFG